MKIEFNNLYTHFVFITLKRQPVIPEKSRIRIEKYITGIDNVCKYILNQPGHHKRVIFAQEYDHFLKFYQANHKVDKVGLWGLLPDY